MRKEDIKTYIDPEGFIADDATYPCDTQYMKYSPLLHRYFLTSEALIENSIGQPASADELDLFIKKVSDAVYNYINYKAGFRNFQIMCYRIATAPTEIYPDKYTMRKQFETALLAQARFFANNTDIRELARVDFTRGIPQPNIIQNAEDDRRDNLHMSPICVEILDTLGLTRWFRAGNNVRLDINKY
jgi:hypothetical protein